MSPMVLDNKTDQLQWNYCLKAAKSHNLAEFNGMEIKLSECKN
jgi:hypothetical protein